MIRITKPITWVPKDFINMKFMFMGSTRVSIMEFKVQWGPKTPSL